MTFLLILAGGAIALLILQKQTSGAPTTSTDVDDESQPNPQTPAEAATFAAMGPQLLAFGKATLGSEPSPALIGMKPDVIAPGSVVPALGKRVSLVSPVVGFADPVTQLKSLTSAGDGRGSLGIAMDPGSKQIAEGIPVAQSVAVKTASPLSGLVNPLATDSTQKGGSIPIPAASTGSPTVTGATAGVQGLGLPPRGYESPAIMGPQPIATIGVATSSPVMPPKPLAVSPPSPPITVPPAQVGSPITATPTPIGPPPPTYGGTLRPIPVTSGPSPVQPAVASPLLGAAPPPPTPITPTSPATVTGGTGSASGRASLL